MGAKDGVGVSSNESLNCGRLPGGILGGIDAVERAGKESIVIYTGEFLLPKAVGVEDVSGVQVRSNPAAKSQSDGAFTLNIAMHTQSDPRSLHRCGLLQYGHSSHTTSRTLSQ